MAAASTDFYPRSPRGERPIWNNRNSREFHYFYPRSPRGERLHSSSERCLAIKLFLSTLPARGATHYNACTAAYKPFLSTLPARGATVGQPVLKGQGIISIHAPREGSDTSRRPVPPSVSIFLSTLPARGATLVFTHGFLLSRYFYPRSPRGERLETYSFDLKSIQISIHAPREGSDRSSPPRITSPGRFLSTLPARGATRCADALDDLLTCISIHAPREGSDTLPSMLHA